MMIHAKLGTGPGEYFAVLRKRKQPVVGDVIEIRPYVAGNYTKWDRVRVTEIREISGKPFYIVERW